MSPVLGQLYTSSCGSQQASAFWRTQNRSGPLILGRIYRLSQIVTLWAHYEPEHPEPFITTHEAKWQSTQGKVTVSTCYPCVPGGDPDTYPALGWNQWCPGHRTTHRCCPSLGKTVQITYRIRTSREWYFLKGLLQLWILRFENFMVPCSKS